MIAVGQRGAGDRLAVDQERLRRRQLADAGAAGRAGDEGEHGGPVAAGDAQVAAGDGADEEAGVGDCVEGGARGAGISETVPD